MKLITGKEVFLSGIEKHEVMKAMAEATLTPYSPSLHKAYEVVLESFNSKWPDNPLVDHYLPTDRHTENPYATLYPYLDEVLFDQQQVNLLRYKKGDNRNNFRRKLLNSIAEDIRRPNMTVPEAQAEIDAYCLENNLSLYDSKRQIRSILKSLGFQPGRPGRKSKM